MNRGLILANLGSPDSYEVKDVRTYLREFLMDERVIDAPYLVRKMIVEGFVLPFRPRKSAEAYKLVWMKEGAPLKVLTEQFKAALTPLVDMPMTIAMRYANPTPAAALKELEKITPNLEEVLIAPLYPHYAMSSYESAYVHVVDTINKLRPDLKIKILQPFYNEHSYIESLKSSIAPYLKESYDHLLFSYHGLPIRHLKKSDPTHSHCYSSDNCCEIASPAWHFCYKHQVIQTTRLVADGLNIPTEKYSYSFQSRLGRDPWIQPFTVQQLENFPKQGIKHLLVACPAFVADCLETLEEMAMRGKEQFIEAGGDSFTLIPCMNTNLQWVETFASYVNETEGVHSGRWK